MSRVPRKRVLIVLPEVDRVRWQAAADLSGIALDLVRDAVENEIEARTTPEFRRASTSHPRRKIDP